MKATNQSGMSVQEWADMFENPMGISSNEIEQTAEILLSHNTGHPRNEWVVLFAHYSWALQQNPMPFLRQCYGSLPHWRVVEATCRFMVETGLADDTSHAEIDN